MGAGGHLLVVRRRRGRYILFSLRIFLSELSNELSIAFQLLRRSGQERRARARAQKTARPGRQCRRGAPENSSYTLRLSRRAGHRLRAGGGGSRQPGEANHEADRQSRLSDMDEKDVG